MRWLPLVLILGLLGWQGLVHHAGHDRVVVGVNGKDDSVRAVGTPTPARTTTAPAAFRCDGRTHCSQMTSCEEATFFLKNCPDVEMDGEGDGVPCERQWCGHR